MKISLVGYMGVGKSEVAKQLSDILEIPFMDLDKLIEDKERKSINEIFKTKGELYFRKLEHECLEEVLMLDDFILATGGGTPVFYNNMTLLNDSTSCFFLLAKPTVLSKRLCNEKEQRPLISHLKDEQLTEFIAKHLFERNPFYQKAEYMLNTYKKSPKQIALEIINTF